jgi:hypothetical protein
MSEKDNQREKYQEVFNKLSELEEFFYYKAKNPTELAPFAATLDRLHQEARDLLLQWHNLTGCENQ